MAGEQGNQSETRNPDRETGGADGGAWIARYGSMRLLGEFSARRSPGRGEAPYRRNDEVIVRSERGVEVATLLSPATERSREMLGPKSGRGRVLRRMSDDDRRQESERTERESSLFQQGAEMIAEHRLQMQLVDVEQVFGGERLIFYYLAEKRVDFRDLVKGMARHFNTRIEMRQIGIRDEARLLADYGDCGKPVCCNTHLQEMPPVSMKMAKLQKATLDPNKISGRCGRLKCCLRYEYDTYAENARELPSVGSTVVTKTGQGRVVAQELLARKLVVSYEGGRRIMTDEADIVTVVSRGKRGPRRGAGRSESADRPHRQNDE